MSRAVAEFTLLSATATAIGSIDADCGSGPLIMELVPREVNEQGWITSSIVTGTWTCLPDSDSVRPC